jgi:hypothetical protein
VLHSSIHNQAHLGACLLRHLWTFSTQSGSATQCCTNVSFSLRLPTQFAYTYFSVCKGQLHNMKPEITTDIFCMTLCHLLHDALN